MKYIILATLISGIFIPHATAVIFPTTWTERQGSHSYGDPYYDLPDKATLQERFNALGLEACTAWFPLDEIAGKQVTAHELSLYMELAASNSYAEAHRNGECSSDAPTPATVCAQHPKIMRSFLAEHLAKIEAGADAKYLNGNIKAPV